MHCLKNIHIEAIRALIDRYRLTLKQVNTHEAIPYSFWGAPEAGRYQSTLYVREDTPLHSLLHEACHFICMPPAQRTAQSHDAGGSAEEENACCYLQIVLSDYIEGFSRALHLHDMDAWGYSFRLGSSSRWFYADSTDTRAWLIAHGILNDRNQPTWQWRMRD